MHRGGVHAERWSSCGCGLDPARAPDAEVAVELHGGSQTSMYIYMTLPPGERASPNLQSTISTHISKYRDLDTS